MDLNNAQRYTNAYPTQWKITPRQPLFGQYAITDTEIFRYDLGTPYGVILAMSNAANEDLVMVGFGMIIRVGIVAPANCTLTIQADPTGNGTFAEIDTSPVAIVASAKMKLFTFGPIPAFTVRGRLAGDGSVYRYHASCTDY